MTNQQKIPTWFWIAGTLLLIWNLMGLMNFIMQLTVTEETLAKLSEIDREFMGNYPAWVFAAFGTAVIGGVLGSLALLIKKKIANVLFILSLAGIIVQFSYSLSIALSMNEYIMRITGMAIVLVAIGGFAIWLANNSIKKGWVS